MNADSIARERISVLLRMASEKWPGDKKLSKRYVSLARKIAMRHRVKLGNRLFCKGCGAPSIPGTTVKVRRSPRQKATVYSCLECGARRKFACG